MEDSLLCPPPPRLPPDPSDFLPFDACIAMWPSRSAPVFFTLTLALPKANAVLSTDPRTWESADGKPGRIDDAPRVPFLMARLLPCSARSSCCGRAHAVTPHRLLHDQRMTWRHAAQSEVTDFSFCVNCVRVSGAVETYLSADVATFELFDLRLARFCLLHSHGQQSDDNVQGGDEDPCASTTFHSSTPRALLLLCTAAVL